ncbi:transmembrane protein 65 isoform x2 [Limosa lapponica baueri]|uniref:Transmembrane protein 65 isoform x2 n=1 Tax=Limosa lapponica baueri TaxID=1758121 RepID=A0A2I0TIP8_LIMLA|nr:transmembrane protein 65 isoform x2 [Limosa lapponica baueri]
MEALNTAQGARDFIYSLHSTERSCLLRELHRFESIAIAQGLAVEEQEQGSASCPLWGAGMEAGWRKLDSQTADSSQGLHRCCDQG